MPQSIRPPSSVLAWLLLPAVTLLSTGATRLYRRAGMHSDSKHQHDLYEKELRPGIDLATQSVDG